MAKRKNKNEHGTNTISKVKGKGQTSVNFLKVW